MNWKLIVLGGLAYFVGTMVVGMAVTGPLIHEGILDEAYKLTTSFWRPELTMEPPDMAALMPMWIANSVISSLVVATIYGWLRPAFKGPGWKRGLSYGLVLTLIAVIYYLGWSGVFNLPGKIWVWWTIDTLIMVSVGCTLLGIVAQKVAPD